MKRYRAVVTILMAFLVGGSSAEVAVQTHRALQKTHAQEMDGGSLVALEVRDDDGAVIARPRVVAVPGRPSQLVLRDPAAPDRVRLTFKVEASREASGEISVDYELTMPGEELACAGRLHSTPGVEYALDVGGRPLTAVLLTLPVPSAAFDAFLEAEQRRVRHT